MGTNFEIVTTDKEGREVSREHIGKLSLGWVFQFNGREHTTVAAWQARLAALEGNEFIETETRETYSAEDFWKAVQRTKSPWGGSAKITPLRQATSPKGKRWTDNGFGFSGYAFS